MSGQAVPTPSPSSRSSPRSIIRQTLKYPPYSPRWPDLRAVLSALRARINQTATAAGAAESYFTYILYTCHTNARACMYTYRYKPDSVFGNRAGEGAQGMTRENASLLPGRPDVLLLLLRHVATRKRRRCSNREESARAHVSRFFSPLFLRRIGIPTHRGGARKSFRSCESAPCVFSDDLRAIRCAAGAPVLFFRGPDRLVVFFECN